MSLGLPKNNKQLEALLKPGLRSAVQYVLDKISDENQYAIMKEIYYAGAGPSDYEQTGQFAKAWDTAIHSTAAIKNATVEGAFFYKPSDMTSTPPSPENNYMGQHHGIGDGWGDSREYLAEIIYEGLAGEIYGTGFWTKKRDAWSVLLKRVGKANMKKWMREGLEYSGFTVVRSGGSIQVENT